MRFPDAFSALSFVSAMLRDEERPHENTRSVRGDCAVPQTSCPSCEGRLPAQPNPVTLNDHGPRVIHHIHTAACATLYDPPTASRLRAPHSPRRSKARIGQATQRCNEFVSRLAWRRGIDSLLGYGSEVMLNKTQEFAKVSNPQIETELSEAKAICFGSFQLLPTQHLLLQGDKPASVVGP